MPSLQLACRWKELLLLSVIGTFQAYNNVIITSPMSSEPLRNQLSAETRYSESAPGTRAKGEAVHLRACAYPL